MTKFEDMPTSVYPCGVEFEIKIKRMPKDEWGETVGPDHKIYISTGQSFDEMKRTLFHEYLHALFHVTGLSRMLPAGSGIDAEEAVVTCLEENMFHLIDFSKIGNKP